MHAFTLFIITAKTGNIEIRISKLETNSNIKCSKFKTV